MPEFKYLEFDENAAKAEKNAAKIKDVSNTNSPVLESLGETMFLSMGPSHPSMHGVLRFMTELDGETIVKITPDIGYLHRGDEKIAENVTWHQFIPYTDRLDYLAPVANNVAYVMAVEKLLGITDQIPERTQFIRVICCELARISSHLVGIGCFGMDLGALTVFLHAYNEREKIFNLFESLSGARFTTSYPRIGGLSRDLPEGWLGEVDKFCDTFLKAVDDLELFLTRNRIWLDRTEGIGVITKKQAISWGLTGINLRASGGNFDLRRDDPYLVYNRLNFDVPVGTVGDCYERYLLRILEMRESVNILRQCTKLVPNGPINIEDSKIILPPKKRAMTRMEDLIHHFMLATEGITAPPGEVYFGAENPKGELGFYIYSKGGGTPYRLKIRPPSFVSISVMPLLLKGAMISDVPAVIGSLDIVMGECDR